MYNTVGVLLWLRHPAALNLASAQFSKHNATAGRQHLHILIKLRIIVRQKQNLVVFLCFFPFFSLAGVQLPVYSADLYLLCLIHKAQLMILAATAEEHLCVHISHRHHPLLEISKKGMKDRRDGRNAAGGRDNEERGEAGVG